MTAQDEQAFLDAILATPDDDTPRLVFADWLDERAQTDDTARAALIRAQCRLEHLSPHSKERRELARRAKAILQKHEKHWTKELRESGVVDSWEYRRGFLDRVEMSASAFADEAEELFELAPMVRSARFPDASNELDEVAGCPYLARLTSVDVRGMCSCGYCPIQNDLRALFRSKHNHNLTRLNIADNRMDEAGAKRLAAAKGLANLVELDLSHNWLGTGGIPELGKAKHLTKLTTLDLSNVGIHRDQTEQLARLTNLPALKHLRLWANSLDAECVRLLISWPRFAQLESLDLCVNPIGATGARLLAALPPTVALKRLDVRRCRLTEPALRALKKRFGKGLKA